LLCRFLSPVAALPHRLIAYLFDALLVTIFINHTRKFLLKKTLQIICNYAFFILPLQPI
jgi:hypothetical protein